MKKSIYLFLIMFFCLISCSSNEIFNYEKDTPEWLKTKIDSISTSNQKYYFGTKVYRYEWNEEYVYHIKIPISSCMYCELFDDNGSKVQFTDNERSADFAINKKNETLVWQWENLKEIKK